MKTKISPPLNPLTHLMLNCGCSTKSPRSAFGKAILDGLASFVTQKGEPPFPIPWDVSLAINTTHQFAVFALSRDSCRLVTCVLSFGSEDEIPWQVAMGSHEA